MPPLARPVVTVAGPSCRRVSVPLCDQPKGGLHQYHLLLRPVPPRGLPEAKLGVKPDQRDLL